MGQVMLSVRRRDDVARGARRGDGEGRLPRARDRLSGLARAPGNNRLVTRRFTAP